jgi:tetratricopeptide (TPR) repeat protein
MDIGSFVVLACFGLIGLLTADLRWDRKWSLKNAELSAQGRWKEMNAHFERRLACRRPFLRLHDAIARPGLLDAQYGLHLSNQGHNEKGLEWADRAVKRKSWRRKQTATLQQVRAHILCRIGRYEEAKAAVEHSRRADPGSGLADMLDAMIELNLGLIEVALTFGKKAFASGNLTDPARSVVSSVLALQKRFQEALDVLVYEPTNVLAFFSNESLSKVTSDDLGKDLVLRMDEEIAGIFRPGRYLSIAEVCIAAGDVANLEKALHGAQRELRFHPDVERIYWQLRAICHGLKGEASGAEESLKRARDLTVEVPTRLARFYTHCAGGRAYFHLGRSDVAISEFQEATQLALHPLEKHLNNYWLARALEAAGQKIEAGRIFGVVTEDGFATWMTSDAENRRKALGSGPN